MSAAATIKRKVAIALGFFLIFGIFVVAYVRYSITNSEAFHAVSDLVRQSPEAHSMVGDVGTVRLAWAGDSIIDVSSINGQAKETATFTLVIAGAEGTERVSVVATKVEGDWLVEAISKD